MDLYWTRLVVFIEYPSEATTDVQKGGKAEIWIMANHASQGISYKSILFNENLSHIIQIKVNLMLYCLQS